jgi:uracil-DNA glycosylase
VRHAGYAQPELPAGRDHIRVVVVSAAPGPDPVTPSASYAHPAVRSELLAAFRNAGYDVQSLDDIDKLGVYCTTAVKCPKVGYGLKSETVTNCSFLLEAELDRFPNLKSIVLMGNTAIRAINTIATRRLGHSVIPSGSAYKVKGHEYGYGDITLFPSYTASGHDPSVDRKHQEVIAIDLRNALEIAGGPTSRPGRTAPPRERNHSIDSRPHETRSHLT